MVGHRENRYTLRRTDHAITDPVVLDALMRAAMVGRVAALADGEPYVIPMNFAYEEGRILLHGANQGRFLRAIARQPRVCFEVDEFLATLPDPVLCDYDTAFASVICVGAARVIESLEERTDALRILARKYAPEDEAAALKPSTVAAYRGKYDAHTAVIGIAVEVMTGKWQPLETPAIRRRDARAMTNEALRGIGAGPAVPACQGRVITPGELLVTPHVLLKWYELRPGEAIIPRDMAGNARRCVHAAVETGTLPCGNGLGFAILRFEPPEASLLVGIWHGVEDLYEARFTQAAGGAFEAVSTGSGLRASTVWDLAAVWHEREAWMRYVASARGEEAARAYLSARLVALL